MLVGTQDIIGVNLLKVLAVSVVCSKLKSLPTLLQVKTLVNIVFQNF